MSKLEKWSGGSLALAFVLIALLIPLFHVFVVIALSDWWGKPDAPAWVQAIGSVVAIIASGAGVRYQLKAARERKVRDDLDRQIALYAGAILLMDAAYRIAEKLVSESDGDRCTTTLMDCLRELGVTGSALGRVDHLRFDSLLLVRGVLVAEAVSSELRAKTTKLFEPKANAIGETEWNFVRLEAEKAMLKLKQSMDPAAEALTHLRSQKEPFKKND